MNAVRSSSVVLRSTMAILLAWTLASADAASPSTAVAAVNCTGNAVPNNGRLYSAADVTLSDAAIGVKGLINWTNPDPCTTGDGNAFTLEAVTLCKTSSCDAWVQPGWRKNQGDTQPHMVCEFHDGSGATPPRNHIYDFPLTTSSHTFQMLYDASHGEWTCYKDGTAKFTRTVYGMGNGTWVNGQGETNAEYAQIGKVWPNYLDIEYIKFYRGGVWNIANVQLSIVDSEYGGAIPSTGWQRNWTW